MNNILPTKYGLAFLAPDGYYSVYSKVNKWGIRLHRLIARDYFGDWIDDPDDYYELHNIDGDRTNNCVLNLIPLKKEDHMREHMKGNTRRKGIPHSDEIKKRISAKLTGRTNDIETLVKMSKHQNTTGYFRVSKKKSKYVKSGYRYDYSYYENSKRKHITSVDLKKLEQKVKEKGLEWFKLQGDEKQ